MCVCVCVHVFFQSSHRSDTSKLIELVVFFRLLSFWGKGEGAPAIIRRAGAMFGSCGLLFTSAMSVASHRWISSAWRQDCVFHVCHGEESALKGGRTPIFEGLYVVSAFWSWLGF